MTLVHVYNTILYKLRIPGGFRICKKKKKKNNRKIKFTRKFINFLT